MLALLRLCLITLALTASAFAQTAAAFTYEVVSIKPDKSGTGNVSVNTSNDRYAASNVSLKSLLEYAYDLKTENQILALPGWAGDIHFDLEAKMDADTVAALKKLTPDERNATRREMMQAVLAERFQLKLHHQSKELPLYALVVGRNGAKLQAVAGPAGSSRVSIHNDDGKLEMLCTAASMADLATTLTHQVDRIVVDQTSLPGKYDVTLRWASDNVPAESAGSAPGIFTAIEEQLGLKLEPSRGPIDCIVIESLQQPSGN